MFINREKLVNDINELQQQAETAYELLSANAPTREADRILAQLKARNRIVAQEVESYNNRIDRA